MRLRVREEANPSDLDWLQLEFENHTGNVIEFGKITFRIESTEAHDLETGAEVPAAMSVRGSTCDLLPHSPGRSFVLKPGVTRSFEYLSDSAVIHLGMPPSSGWCIRAAIWVSVARPGEMHPARDSEPLAEFEFHWLRPDELGLQRLRELLDERLLHPQKGFAYNGRLVAMLRMPGVGDRVPLETLISALMPTRQGPVSGRHYIVGHLDWQFHDDARLASWIQRRLDASDALVVKDLSVMRNTWRPEFLTSLLRLYEAGNLRVLELLESHGAPHASDQSATRRLAAPLLARLPVDPRKSIERVKQERQRHALREIARTIRRLGLTRNRELVPRLSAWLDCEEPLFVTRPIGIPSLYPPEQRLCDVALAALLRVLGEDPVADYHAVAGMSGALDQSLEFAASTRDRMINDLKVRLAEAGR